MKYLCFSIYINASLGKKDREKPSKSPKMFHIQSFENLYVICLGIRTSSFGSSKKMKTVNVELYNFI